MTSSINTIDDVIDDVMKTKKSEFKDRVKMLEGCISGSIHFVMMLKGWFYDS